MVTAETNDAALVAESLSGNREAFAQIVNRYQSLVCSLAYSATGSLSQSEDLAQETFVIAWRNLKGLNEPEKLRPWLCGIARNVISNTWRRNKREPSQDAEPIESAHEFPSHETPAFERVIQREEEAILWRSLERIPESYREPLILFYRQGESIERVAQLLELSEDTVKQRLSRGRKYLADEVTAFVEGTLRQSAPGRAFTLGVIASLPMFATSASAATISAGAAKGTATAGSSAIVAWLGALLGPVLGILGAYIGVKASIDAARTPREREFVIQQTKRMIVAIVGFALVMFAYIWSAQKWWKESPALFLTLGVAVPLGYTIWIILNALRFNRLFREVRSVEKERHPEAFEDEIKTGAVKEYRSRTTLLGLPLVHVRNGRAFGEKPKPAVGWIALGDRAYGILFAAGGLAIGGISMGGVSIGIISMGGLSAGLLAIGGFALGGVALGGAAVGLLAAGGIAAAWFGAQGGTAFAREFAIGGITWAQHMNDASAKEFFQRWPWLDLTNPTSRNRLMLICWAPVLSAALVWSFMSKRNRNRK